VFLVADNMVTEALGCLCVSCWCAFSAYFHGRFLLTASSTVAGTRCIESRQQDHTRTRVYGVPRVKHVKSCLLRSQTTSNTTFEGKQPGFLSHISRLTSLVALPGRRPLATDSCITARLPTSTAHSACRSLTTTQTGITRDRDH